MSLIEIHGRLANTVLLYTIAMAIWGLWRFFRRQGVDSNYWGGLVISEILYLAQGVLGMYLYLSKVGHLGNPVIHILYGVVTLIVVPGVFVFTRGADQRRVSLIYSLGFIFLIGIALRSMATSG